MTFEDYLIKYNLTYAKFAKLSGLTRDKVRKYALRKTKPSLQSVIAIQKATNNEVQPIDFQEEK